MARQSHAPILLMTRPLAQGQRFALQLQAELGPMEVIQNPLICPQFLPANLPAGLFSALILTSGAGVEAARRISAAGHALPLRAYCVGSQTAEAARLAGFQPISADGDAEDLIALIKGSGEAGPMLHLRGEESRGAVAKRLISAGIETFEAVVYRQIPQSFGPDFQEVLRGQRPVIVPLFSPRTAQIFMTSVPRMINAPLWIAALSQAVAAELGGARADRLTVADHPDAPAMIAAVKALLAAGALP